jgi:polyhydroxybutyrate depolymerase
MKKIFLLIYILIFTTALNAQQYTIQHGGLTRSYWLHLPAGYQPEKAYPLVFSLHGLTSNGFQQMMLTGFNNVSDEHGFIVVYPDGIDNAWNVASAGGVDDVGFISSLIDSISAQYSVNQEMVYSSGMSMGGFMSYRLACELGHRLAAIASVTGLQVFYPCQPSKPMPVMQIHGTADPTVPYAGVASTISFWVDNNGCPTEPVNTDFPDIDQTDNSTVTSSYYGPCNNSTEVILYTVINGEHSWPGSNFILGVTNQDINASQEIWNFFRKFNLQGSTFVSQLPGGQDNIRVFPNPVKDVMHIELTGLKDNPVLVSIYDLSGKVMMEMKDVEGEHFQVDCQGFAPGMYFIEIKSGGTKVRTKFVVR